MVAALLIISFPFVLAWLVWMVVFLANDPSEEFRQTRHERFLGPGGPDDPFAGVPWND